MQHASLLLFYACMTATMQLPEVAFRIYLVQHMGFRPATYAMVISTYGIPWAVKPLWGFMVDNIHHRWLCVMLCSWGFVACWLAMGLAANESATGLSAVAALSSACLCVMDVIADADLVIRVREEDDDSVGILQSHVWIARASGSFVAAIAGGLLSRSTSVYNVFIMNGLIIIPGAFGLIASLVPRRASGCSEVMGKVRLLYTTVKKPSIWKPCVFIFVLSAIPTCYFALAAFMQTTLDFTPMQFASIDAVTNLAHIAGATLFRTTLRKWSFRNIFYAGIAVLLVLRSMQLILITRTNIKLHIPDLAFAMAEDVAFSIVGQVLIMPVCVLGARLCPPGIEGALYSTLMAVANLGGLVASWLGAALSDAFGITNDNYEHLWQMSVLCAALSIVPVFFVRFMPVAVPASTPADKQGNTSGSCKPTSPGTLRGTDGHTEAYARDAEP
tara:strand:- start:4749 stop:6080 length:1332 start_codon:yes stop_codon:yes gene_type:complete